jgi:hypothetical protein
MNYQPGRMSPNGAKAAVAVIHPNTEHRPYLLRSDHCTETMVII